MATRVTLDQLHTQLERYWDEDGLGNKPEGSLKRYLARLDGEDLVKALNKSIGCDCCADSDFYRIRGSLIKELVRRAGIKDGGR